MSGVRMHVRYVYRVMIHICSIITERKSRCFKLIQRALSASKKTFAPVKILFYHIGMVSVGSVY